MQVKVWESFTALFDLTEGGSNFMDDYAMQRGTLCVIVVFGQARPPLEEKAR